MNKAFLTTAALIATSFVAFGAGFYEAYSTLSDNGICDRLYGNQFASLSMEYHEQIAIAKTVDTWLGAPILRDGFVFGTKFKLSQCDLTFYYND